MNMGCFLSIFPMEKEVDPEYFCKASMFMFYREKKNIACQTVLDRSN